MTLSLFQEYFTLILGQISLLSILITCTQLQHKHTQSDPNKKIKIKTEKNPPKTIQCKGQKIKTIQSPPPPPPQKKKKKMHPPNKKRKN